MVPALEWMAGGLLRASIYGAVFIGIVWVLCRLAPRLPAAARSLLWWCAALKLLVDFAWLSPIRVPVLPMAAEAPPAAIGIVAGASPLLPGVTPIGVAPGGSQAAAPPATKPTVTFANRLAAIGLVWGAAVAVVLGRTIRRGRRTMTIVRSLRLLLGLGVARIATAGASRSLVLVLESQAEDCHAA
jgi:hypothetical protein